MKQWMLYSLVLLSFVMWTSCGSDNNVDVGLQPISFYPLELGKFQEFQVDTTFYDDNGANIFTVSSFVREAITDKIEDEFGNQLYVIERAWRRSIDQEWISLDLWQIRIDRGDIIRTEDNLEFLTIKSPVQESQSWDPILFDKTTIVKVVGESIEMYKAWNANVVSIGKIETIGTFSFDDVLTIDHADDENLIERRYVREKYQSGLGLVYKKMEILDTQCIEACEGQTWEEKAERGFIMEATLVAHN